MSLDNVTPGKNAPDQFNVIIEIPMNADPIKYEVDKETGAIFVDRFMSTAMHYPCNYGYIPQTLVRRWRPGGRAGDHAVPLIPGVVVTCRPGRPEDGRRGGWRRQVAGRADDKILLDLFPLAQARRPQPDAPEDHPAFLRALQGSGAGQVGQVKGWEGPESAKAEVAQGIKAYALAPKSN